MCGIAGQYCLDGKEPDLKLLSVMSERLAHRGPDGKGIHTSGPVALAHRRLAIIDLSEEGLQPMTSEDGTMWLVFNGEIYNFVELREELIEKGHRFHSKSDTEVILHAYEEWGHECLNRFNGMWAFALWDDSRQELFCARDRFGIKPFYYAQTGDSFLFASEIKALLAHPDVGTKPDDATLGSYLAWGVLDHSERTMFNGILQLRPAYAMVVTKDGTQLPFRYWDVSVNAEIDEFGMWLHLGGSYWQRVSVDAVIVVAALFGLVAFARTLKRFERHHFWLFFIVLVVVLGFGAVIYIAGSRLGEMVGQPLRELESASSP